MWYFYDCTSMPVPMSLLCSVAESLRLIAQSPGSSLALSVPSRGPSQACCCCLCKSDSLQANLKVTSQEP